MKNIFYRIKNVLSKIADAKPKVDAGEVAFALVVEVALADPV